MTYRYEFETEPWEHQRTALRRSWKRPGYAYLMEMGTGKSKVACDEAGIYHETDLIDIWIVMAPKGVYRNWVREGGEIETHLPRRIRERARIAVWEAGGGTKANQRALRRLLEPHDGLRILVINTEAVSSPGNARKFLEMLLRAGRVLWHLDEASLCKNPNAKRTKYILEVRSLAAYRRILTGSPGDKPTDVWSQFEFLESAALGHRSFYSFQRKYAIVRETDFGGKLRRPVKLEVGYRNLDDLRRRMDEMSYRVRKEECLDLPPKIYTTRDVELTEDQVRIYREMQKNAIAILDQECAEKGFVSAQSALTQIMALARIVCGHVRNADGEEHDIPTNRVDALAEVLQETSGKVIIWSRFRRDIEKIVHRIGRDWDERRAAQYHGGNVQTRQADVVRFLEDPECLFMVSNQQAGGYGNTWNVAHTTVYFSNDFYLERRLQSEDRNHRGGQTESVTYVDLVARGTIDEKHVESLRSKLDMASALTGDGYREWLI